ncbi:hypothetical protein AB1Y20_016146 [Prymnesium parvum]|uniref:Uncharacterized protein n=1 Tax=Prymnesium parvum TaxID=97485 RepID=A0AB34JZT1_PRYPA|mmetsp:Transcript_22050/g.46690  ORF Transcript_22050/g.46690 Transcript_22050/m.46690 type:complete len:205 (+) Transcript_22050:1-615(+)
MGWEWRVFFRPLDAGSLVHPALHGGQPEQRTDVYLPHNHEIGLKLRGDAADVELKVLKERDSNGWEKWKKSRFSGMEECEAAIQALGEEQRRKLDLPAPTVSVGKRRLQAFVHEALVEQTELQLSLGGQSQAWRTVAVEGKRKQCALILQHVMSACREQAVEGELLCGGYPMFVIHAARQTSGAGGKSPADENGACAVSTPGDS